MFRKDDNFKLQEKYYKFIKEFEEKICKVYINGNYSNLIFLCIGTNKIVGDSVGPIIGNNLKSIENEYMQIYGTLDNTLNFINAKQTIEKIYNNFEKPFLFFEMKLSLRLPRLS